MSVAAALDVGSVDLDRAELGCVDTAALDDLDTADEIMDAARVALDRVGLSGVGTTALDILDAAVKIDTGGADETGAGVADEILVGPTTTLELISPSAHAGMHRLMWQFAE